jgi:hypothetical protein
MALKLNFSALSLSGSVDNQTGNLSVFDILEEIRAPQLPIALPSVVISLSLIKTTPVAESGKIFIHLIAPDGKQALLGNGDMQVPAEQRRLKAVFRFGGFPVTQFGNHRIVVSWVNAGGTKEGEALFDFDVIQTKAPAEAPQGQGGGANGNGNKNSVTH